MKRQRKSWLKERNPVGITASTSQNTTGWYQLVYKRDLQIGHLFYIKFIYLQQKLSSKKAEFDKEKCKEADKFKWRDFTDPLLKREFSKIVDIGGARLPDGDFIKVL